MFIFDMSLLLIYCFITVKLGVNTIERSSVDSVFTSKDFVGSDYFYKKLLKAIEGNEPFKYTDKVYGFPNNLYLPKGSYGGKPFKFFFFVTPVDESKISYYNLPIFGKFLYDGKSFGYPLDRPMYPHFFDVSNFYYKDVGIYYEGYYGQEYYNKEYYGKEYYGKENYGKEYYYKGRQHYDYKDAHVGGQYPQKYEGKPYYHHMDYDRSSY